jgi:hypothetical protein
MIDLRRDLFARLVISSHKEKILNRPFRVIHGDVWKPMKTESFAHTENTLEEFPESKSLEKELSKVSSNTPVNNVSRMESAVSKTPTVQKIDEKVASIVNDPVLIEIQIELEFAEQLLAKIKSVDKHNPKIPVIEDTVLKLRALLNEKMYV